MKRGISIILAIMFATCLAGCSSGDKSSAVFNEINPLSEKQYEAFVIDEDIDFLDFFNSLNQEYSDLIIGLSDYIEIHGTEIENENKGFSDFSDYAESLDNFYSFLYGVMYCDSGNVPEVYKDAWSYYKTTIAANKADLDNLYFLKGEDLISAFSDMLTSIEAGATLVSDAMPYIDDYNDLEIVAAEFCMAYMNHLKNPYSFTVKSIWAYESLTGGYHVYVKYTAQNSFGADVVREITNTVPITDSVLEAIAKKDEILSSLNIYVSEGQSERNDGTNGEWLDADKIQSYIDANYS